MATLLGWRTQSLGDWRRQHSGIVGNDKLVRDGLTCIFRSAATATECREAPGVRGACSRFRARWVARKRQQAGRTPNASRGSPALEVREACSRFRARWVARKRQQAGRTLQTLREVRQRMKCVELAPAFERGGWPESASKLDALSRRCARFAS